MSVHPGGLSPIRPDNVYLIKGEYLIRLRTLVNNLQEDVSKDHMSAEEIEIRLHAIRDVMPKDPPEAF